MIVGLALAIAASRALSKVQRNTIRMRISCPLYRTSALCLHVSCVKLRDTTAVARQHPSDNLRISRISQSCDKGDET